MYSEGWMLTAGFLFLLEDLGSLVGDVLFVWALGLVLDEEGVAMGGSVEARSGPGRGEFR